MSEKVCPRCGDGRPCCADKKSDGAPYTHAETCATYEYADDVCASCKADMIASDIAGPTPSLGFRVL